MRMELFFAPGITETNGTINFRYCWLSKYLEAAEVIFRCESNM